MISEQPLKQLPASPHAALQQRPSQCCREQPEQQTVKIELGSGSMPPESSKSDLGESGPADTAHPAECAASVRAAEPAAMPTAPSHRKFNAAEGVGASPSGENAVKRTLPWWNRRCCKCCVACTPACSFLAFVGVFVVILLVFSIGFAVERRSVKHLPFVFYGDSVCSVTNATFPNASAAHAAGDLIRHCGDCGQCSTAGDIFTLEATVGTITATGSACGAVGAFQGSDAAIQCFVERVNFTSGCAQCWLENILCDVENCLFTCLLYVSLVCVLRARVHVFSPLR